MRHLLSLFVFCALALAVPLSASDSDSPELTDIIVTTSDKSLLLFATVKNSFTREMVAGIRNGLPIRFTYYIKLDRVRGGWFDRNLVDSTISHSLSYDVLKEEYQVEISGKQSRRITTRSLSEAKQLMAELSGVAVISLSELEPDAPYALHIKATLEENTLPLGMHYVLPFTSLWNFETDWRTIEFRY